MHSPRALAMYGLYDRQVRLFGQHTQDLIEKAHVCIIQTHQSYCDQYHRDIDIGGEIIKNLALLGVRTISASKCAIESFKRMFHGCIKDINSEIEINEVNSINVQHKYTFIIFINGLNEYKLEGIYACSKCMSFHSALKLHICSEASTCISFANDCLLGAIIVQEWIKKLQGKPCVECYTLCL
ncbi:E1 ubiquitin activating enzyme-like protein [Ordospora colligata]|nr:E1 ubiquitin activating enzyme-like protein [Ordospora colligata]TBU14767.1 E1 ubiquitin activating enzyme-like protein [Ordospora colligata]